MDNRYDISQEDRASLSAQDLIDLADLMAALTTLELAISAAVVSCEWGLVIRTPGAKDIWLRRAKDELLKAREKAIKLTGLKI